MSGQHKAELGAVFMTCLAVLGTSLLVVGIYQTSADTDSAWPAAIVAGGVMLFLLLTTIAAIFYEVMAKK